ncbi:cyclic nucleotide-binding domain-containing protein [Nitrobacter sp.]|uniref:hypothetical protein n=1 Tax=Nitrobacter sp. TaxID=29420 RepID=UPI00399D761D
MLSSLASIRRAYLMPSGRRQYLSFHLKGDIPDAQMLFMDHGLCAMDHAMVASIPHSELTRVFRDRPMISSWMGALMTHLNRYKRFPPAASTGIATVAFTINRSGRVLAAAGALGRGRYLILKPCPCRAAPVPFPRRLPTSAADPLRSLFPSGSHDDSGLSLAIPTVLPYCRNRNYLLQRIRRPLLGCSAPRSSTNQAA